MFAGLTLARALTTNYYTGFEAGEGYTTGPGLVGQNGWDGVVYDETGTNLLYAGSEGNGILNGVFPGLGQQAYVGLTPLPYFYGPLFVYKTFPPGVPAGTVSAIKFSSRVRVVDSTTANYDYFYLDLFDSQDNDLVTLVLANTSLKIYYWDVVSNAFVWTGQTFANSQSYQLDVTLNPSNNTWSATFGGTPLIGGGAAISGQPIPPWSTNISTIQFEWDQYDYANPGDNYLAVDNLLVTTEAAGVPSPNPPVLARPSKVPSGSVMMRLVGQEGYTFAIETLTNLVFPGTWIPVTTNVVTGGFFDYTDTTARGLGNRYYRARWIDVGGLPTPSQPNLGGPSLVPAGSVMLRLTGQEGYKFSIDATTNVTSPGNWMALQTNTVSGGYFNYTDTNAASFQGRYYRARWVP